MTVYKSPLQIALLLLACLIPLGGCSTPGGPDEAGPMGRVRPSEYKEAIFDFYIGDLNDPEVLAKYSRVDILITDPSRFWGKDRNEGDIALLKAANPELKVIGFFRSKCVRQEWDNESESQNAYLTELYEASLPYWSYTTTGDTLRDWPGVILFDTTNPQARKAMRDVFVSYQHSSTNKLDGLYWDYFNEALWISPEVTGMTGEPDLDGDGVAHWDDPDELDSYKASEVASIREMRAVLGDDFVQIANGWRALRDSTFAGMLDGMFYELFPNVGFTSGARYSEALDLAVSNNIFAAAKWPKSSNGGPWLILSNKNASSWFLNEQGVSQIVNLGDVNRAIALLADCTSVYYDLSGRHSAGPPTVKLSLGRALGPTTIAGNQYTRVFENGQVEVVVGAPGGPFPVTFSIQQGGALVQEFDLPTIYP